MEEQPYNYMLLTHSVQQQCPPWFADGLIAQLELRCRKGGIFKDFQGNHNVLTVYCFKTQSINFLIFHPPCGFIGAALVLPKETYSSH